MSVLSDQYKVLCISAQYPLSSKKAIYPIYIICLTSRLSLLTVYYMIMGEGVDLLHSKHSGQDI